ncbi:MAG: oxygenase MpaB family protein [Solirubrobacteraceae bacterium]
MSTIEHADEVRSARDRAGVDDRAARDDRAATGQRGWGYFDEHSMLRRINRERAVSLSGPRALLMQAAHPLAVSGLLAHSSALDEPYERLARTAQVLSTIGFGSRAEADRLTGQVRAMHRRVSGRLSTAVGPYDAGTPYRADDPALLLWVLFTLVDSALVVYRKYVGSLSREDEAAYWEDYKLIGRLFGLRARDLPVTIDDLDAYRRQMLEGDALFVTEWARRRARKIVLEPPVPWAARPVLETVNFVTIALLPDEIRRQYGFSPIPPTMVRKAVVAGGAEYVRRAVIPFLPDRLRLVPRAHAA